MAFGLFDQNGWLAMSEQWPPAGRSTRSPAQSVREHRAQAAMKVSALEPEERLVLRWLAHGWGAREIGRELGIDGPSYDLKRRRILQKIGAQCTADAVRTAIYAGLD